MGSDESGALPRLAFACLVRALDAEPASTSALPAGDTWAPAALVAAGALPGGQEALVTELASIAARLARLLDLFEVVPDVETLDRLDPQNSPHTRY